MAGQGETMSKEVIKQHTKELCEFIQQMPLAVQVKALNFIRRQLHEVSPFKLEPVDCVQWMEADSVVANDYNPNTVAPPEMKLLQHSILMDGYTQPIVGWKKEDIYEVVDGFHRHRVGKESTDVNKRIHGYLPVVGIKADRVGRSDRMAATVRHNRARGKHRVEAMSDMVIELKRRNWSNERIAKELGMEADEVLRLCQISGLTELFSDHEFSKSWEIEGHITEEDLAAISEDIDTYEDDVLSTKTINTEGRKFHTYDKWECYKAGFYNTTVEGMTKEECQVAYKAFLSDIPRFEKALKHIINRWTHSCEHYLTNPAMNRIAWLGQASACHAMKIPSTFRSGFSLLTQEEQEAANKSALKYLNIWLKRHNLEPVDMATALADTRQSIIY